MIKQIIYGKRQTGKTTTVLQRMHLQLDSIYVVWRGDASKRWSRLFPLISNRIISYRQYRDKYKTELGLYNTFYFQWTDWLTLKDQQRAWLKDKNEIVIFDAETQYEGWDMVDGIKFTHIEPPKLSETELGKRIQKALAEYESDTSINKRAVIHTYATFVKYLQQAGVIVAWETVPCKLIKGKPVIARGYNLNQTEDDNLLVTKKLVEQLINQGVYRVQIANMSVTRQFAAEVTVVDRCRITFFKYKLQDVKKPEKLHRVWISDDVLDLSKQGQITINMDPALEAGLSAWKDSILTFNSNSSYNREDYVTNCTMCPWRK